MLYRQSYDGLWRNEYPYIRTSDVPELTVPPAQRARIPGPTSVSAHIEAPQPMISLSLAWPPPGAPFDSNPGRKVVHGLGTRRRGGLRGERKYIRDPTSGRFLPGLYESGTSVRHATERLHLERGTVSVVPGARVQPAETRAHWQILCWGDSRPRTSTSTCRRYDTLAVSSGRAQTPTWG
jgi:hypothetical protein